MSVAALILSDKADRQRIVADLQARIRDCWTEDRAPIFTQVEKLIEHLARLAREPLVPTIEPLRWHHVDVEFFEANTPLGFYEASCQGWSFEPDRSGRTYVECASIQAAKAGAAQHHENRALRLMGRLSAANKG